MTDTHEPTIEATGSDGDGRRKPEFIATPDRLWSPGSRDAAFVDLCALEDIPAGTLRRVTVGDVDLLIAATAAGLVVTDDRCPHMSAPLSLGTLEGCVVACPLHSGRFDLSSGEAVQWPTTGGLDPDGDYHPVWAPAGSPPKVEPPSTKADARRLTRVRRLRYYPARIRDGRVEARIPAA